VRGEASVDFAQDSPRPLTSKWQTHL